jgi:hypothetical protein
MQTETRSNNMNKKVWIGVLAIVMALSAIAVFAQDGPGVINVTLPDGQIVPVFTDGRINAFDIGAPVVVYYRSEAGDVLNPNFAGSSIMNNVDASATPVGTTVIQPSPNSLLESLQVLAIDQTTSNGNVVIEASVDDLQDLVAGQQNSIAASGYSLNYDRNANWFWIQSPPNFEGKVYTFAWENNLFPRPLVSASPDANATSQFFGSLNEDATAEPTAQATTEATAQPTVQPTATTSP